MLSLICSTLKTNWYSFSTVKYAILTIQGWGIGGGDFRLMVMVDVATLSAFQCTLYHAKFQKAQSTDCRVLTQEFKQALSTCTTMWAATQSSAEAVVEAFLREKVLRLPIGEKNACSFGHCYIFHLTLGSNYMHAPQTHSNICEIRAI